MRCSTRSCLRSNVQALRSAKDIGDFLREYEQYRSEVRKGEHGKTAQHWLTYIDHGSIVLSLLQAVKTNGFELYAQSLCLMPGLFFSFGGINYASYLTFFGLQLINIESFHPGAKELLRNGAFSFARSCTPGNHSSVDKTMEKNLHEACEKQRRSFSRGYWYHKKTLKHISGGRE